MPTDRRPLKFDPIAEAGRQWAARWPLATEAEAAISIFRAYRIVLDTVEAVLEPFELTFARYETLLLLHFTPTGAMALGKVGQRLQVHPTSITNSVDRLVTQGFVERVHDERDRRAILARLTPSGRETVERATAALATSAFGLPGLDGEDLRSLTAVLRKLRLAAGDFDE
ncbi:MAG: MarR family winged helix-turn-helix transcriptional regulator [Candidatus Dormibacteria bacterium]